MATYPSSLPRPQQSDYKLTPTPQVAATDMEVGASRSRRRTRTRQREVSVAFMFSDMQFEIFNDWFYDDTTGLSGGSVWFDMPLLTGEGGVKTKLVKFKGGAFDSQLSGTYWRVTATLEVR